MASFEDLNKELELTAAAEVALAQHMINMRETSMEREVHLVDHHNGDLVVYKITVEYVGRISFQ